MPVLPASYHDQTDVDHLARKFITLGTMLACLVYGVHVATFAVSLQYSVRSVAVPTKQHWITLIYTSLLFALATVGIALQIRWNEIVVIDNNSTSAQFLIENVGSHFNLAKTSIFIVMNLLSDGMLVWRFYGIFGFSIKKVTLPILVLFSPFVLSFVYLSEIAAISVHPWTSIPIFPTMISFSLSISLNACLTFLIVFRLLRMRRGLSPAIPCANIAAMFTQGAILYLVTGLVFIGLCVERSFGQNLVLPVLGQLQALSPLFVIMRVAQSRFWPKPDNGLTTNAELVSKSRNRPSLTLKLDFELPKHDDEDDEDTPSTCRPPSSSLRFDLPSPLPSAKVRKEVVPMDFESARQCSHPPRYTLSQEDILVYSASDSLGSMLEGRAAEGC